MRRFLAVLILLIVPAVLFAGAYGSGNPITLYPGTAVTVWNAETPTVGNGASAASIPVVFGPSSSNRAPGFSVSGQFSAAPGAFEIDVQVSDVDSNTSYQTISGGAITSVDSSNQTFHLDAPYTTCRFARLVMRVRANAVTVTADFSR
jgi:hypothetical protein